MLGKHASFKRSRKEVGQGEEHEGHYGQQVRQDKFDMFVHSEIENGIRQWIIDNGQLTITMPHG